MKEKIKMLVRWIGIFALCFLVIYLVVLFGGWKLFESGDPILIEVGAVLVLSFFVFVANEVITGLEKRVKALEARLNELEGKQ